MTTSDPVEWDDQAPADDEGQLSASDTLEDRGLDDALDEGYSPPENYRGSTAFGTTPAGAEQGESLDPRPAGLVQTAAGERALEVAAGAHQAREGTHLLDGGVERRRVRAGKPSKASAAVAACVVRNARASWSASAASAGRECVRAGQRDGLSRAERLAADDAETRGARAGRGRPAQRAEQRDAREPIGAVERVHEPLDGSPYARASGPKRAGSRRPAVSPAPQRARPAGPDRPSRCARAGARRARLRARLDGTALGGGPRPPTRSTRACPLRVRDQAWRTAASRRSRTPPASATGCALAPDGDDIRLAEIEARYDHAHPRESTRAVRAAQGAPPHEVCAN